MCCIAAGIIITEGHALQKFKISGKVVDFSGSPVSGATVKIKAAGLCKDTDKYGSFYFDSNTGAVNIAGFDLGGKVIYRKRSVVNAGVHAFQIPVIRHCITLFRVNADGKTANLKACSLGRVIQWKVQAESGFISSGVFMKSAVAPSFKDSIFVTKSFCI
jgi:hypothetical protein